MTQFLKTVEALKFYDAGREEREAAWIKVIDSPRINMNNALKALKAMEEAARKSVCYAFYRDTEDINSLDNCLLLHPDDEWLRGLIEKYHGKI